MLNLIGAILRHRRARRAERRAGLWLQRGDLDAALAELSDLAAPTQAAALVRLARTLPAEEDVEEENDEEPDLARRILLRATELCPDSRPAWELLARRARDRERFDEAIAAFQRIAALGAAMEVAEPLAALLIQTGRFDEAITLLRDLDAESEPHLSLRLGEALLCAGRIGEALPLLRDARAHYEGALRHAVGAEWTALRDLAQEAARLHGEAHAARYGRESLVVEQARAGKLDARAGINYQLLGESLMVGARCRAAEIDLASPEATEARAEREEKGSAQGYVQLGAARLRQGRLGEARRLSEKATRVDGKYFAAWLGLGAAMEHERLRLRDAAARLPQLSVRLPGLVPDLDALTELERRVVAASVHPLRAALPLLASEGAHIRILPIDVRPTDLPELADASGERSEDHRAYEAIGGLAIDGLAVAKIESLLDVESHSGWVFAHEFAHLVYFQLPPSLREEVRQLHERALLAGYVADAYQLTNDDEFFAVSYTDSLRRRYEMTEYKEADEGGLLADLFRFFDALAALDQLPDTEADGLRTR